MGPNRGPSAWEVEVLQVIRRMIRGLFSTVNASLLWDPKSMRYVVGVEYDPRIGARLPPEYFGIPVMQYPYIPRAVMPSERGTPGATISYGPTRLALDQGFGIGWPVVSVYGGGTQLYAPANPGNQGGYCNPWPAIQGNPSGMLPALGTYNYRCGCSG